MLNGRKLILLVCLFLGFVIKICGNELSKSKIQIRDTTNFECKYGAFKVIRKSVFLVLPRKLKLKPGERGFLIIEIAINGEGAVDNWTVNLLRILKGKNIVLSYSDKISEKRTTEVEKYVGAIQQYVKGIEILKMSSKKFSEINSFSLLVKLK